jgi:hypothetical protein
MPTVSTQPPTPVFVETIDLTETIVVFFTSQSAGEARGERWLASFAVLALDS